ncbi:hypothetical protein B1A_18896 [mine drainage metagenome]|uniref:RepB-like DNA primase domain-containing protein n=1 Tax=mine drainage metagenome TaxID=410659 RepID=T0YLR0_9ZZZZ
MTAEQTMRHSPPAQQARALIAALRYPLPQGVALQLGLLPRVGRADQGQMQTLTLAAGADPELLLRQARGAQMRADAQVYVRPDPASSHPWLLIDDLPQAEALTLAARKAAAVVRTSPGNCQVRLLADRPLTAAERTACQRALVQRLGGDPGSVAGDKWGRLAGFTNRKPGKLGHWTELLSDSSTTMPPARTAVLLGVAGPVSPPKGGATLPLLLAARRQPGAASSLRILILLAAGLIDMWLHSNSLAARSGAIGLRDGEILSSIAEWLLEHGKRTDESAAMKLARTIFAAASRAQPRGRG